MNRRTFKAEALIVAAGLALLIGLSAVALQRSLVAQNERALRRLEKAIGTIIERAHHGKDDVAIQETVHDLGEAPGVLFAAVVDKEGNFLAHSQPTLLGKPFHRSRLPLAAYPLHEGTDRWGTLVFASSDPSVREGLVQQGMIWFLGGVLFWAAWMVRCRFWNQHVVNQEQEKADLSTMLDDQKRMLIREEENRRKMQTLWTLWLQSAVNQVPRGLLLLDERQRVVAANPRAAHALGVADASALVGKSWPEIPKLSTCGGALEKSLQSPGMDIPADVFLEGSALVLSTLQDGSGTWAMFSTDKHVVE